MDKQIILDAFMFRHACKEFDPDITIAEDDFLFILETAACPRVPSASSLGSFWWSRT